jgi:hypothetical protein
MEPHIINIDDRISEIIEGKRIIVKDDSWPLTAITVPKAIFAQDSKGKRWYIKRNNFILFMKSIIKLNDEIPKTIKEEERARKISRRKHLEDENSRIEVL